jgi:hypothetical protein
MKIPRLLFTLSTLLTGLLAAGVEGQTAVPHGTLRLASSNRQLQNSFEWAVQQALEYSHDGKTDAIGAWYEAALPGRDAFCMRDVSHQSLGAAALGLSTANFNMLSRFAEAISPRRDWAGYWEIDRQGNPSTADYASDDDFWYNLPANFDLLDAVIRMWIWTKDDRYVNDPRFRNYFEKTVKEYVASWNLQPNRILQRDRIMHKRLNKGKFVESRGIPSYTEGRKDFNVGIDLLAAEYRAFEDVKLLATFYAEPQKSKEYEQAAENIRHLIIEHAWLASSHHYAGFLSTSKKPTGSGDMFLLYFGAIHNTRERRAAVDFINSPEYLDSIGIEEESYLPNILFRYGDAPDAYARIADLTNAVKKRREYPEVSFSVVASIVTGLMGIEVLPSSSSKQSRIRTISRLKDAQEEATLSGVHIFGGTIDVEHRDRQTTTFTNRTNHPVTWEATFAGRHPILLVAGESQAAKFGITSNGSVTSFATIDVAPGRTVTAGYR